MGQVTGMIRQEDRDGVEELIEAAALKERLRIAQDLHDRMAQSLVALVVETEALKRKVQRGKTVDALELEQLATSARSALEELRNFVKGLRMRGAASYSLIDRLRAALADVAARSHVLTAFRVFGPRPRLTTEVEETLLRVVGEALNNAERHSGARRIGIYVLHLQDTLEIVIEDDGIGITEDARRQAIVRGHFGLVNMRERVLALGGSLEIKSGPELGTRIKITVPVQAIEGSSL